MGGMSFGSFSLDPVKRLLMRGGEAVPVTPKAFEILLYLIENQGRVVTKEQIMARVWPDTIVEEGNLSVNISVLRKTLGENQHDHKYIITHPGRGYSFVAEVEGLQSIAAAQAASGHGEVPIKSRERSVEMIEPAGGALALNSPFYLERQADLELASAIARHDSLVLIKGARQVGKTSLLARGMQQARESGARVVLTDFQHFDSEFFNSFDRLFLLLAELIADQLDLEISPAGVWLSHLGPGNNLERFMRREVLSKIEEPIVWGIDETDRLFNCTFSSDIFGLFRSWHNRRALDPEGPWSRVTMIMAYATEAHMFISDLNQSPFNVGTRLQLDDFSESDVAELNRRYGAPLRSETEIAGLYSLVGGHPYLVNLCLWEMKTHRSSLADLTSQAERDESIFSDHLKRVLLTITKNDQLKEAIRSVLKGERRLTLECFYRLRSSGIIKGHSAREAEIRCRLYRIYLENRLS